MSKSSLFSLSTPETGLITDETKLCQKAPQVMKKVAFNYGPYTY